MATCSVCESELLAVVSDNGCFDIPDRSAWVGGQWPVRPTVACLECGAFDDDHEATWEISDSDEDPFEIAADKLVGEATDAYEDQRRGQIGLGLWLASSRLATAHAHVEACEEALGDATRLVIEVENVLNDDTNVLAPGPVGDLLSEMRSHGVAADGCREAAVASCDEARRRLREGDIEGQFRCRSEMLASVGAAGDERRCVELLRCELLNVVALFVARAAGDRVDRPVEDIRREIARQWWTLQDLDLT